MRENCTSGSEGGGIETNRSSLPLSDLADFVRAARRAQPFLTRRATGTAAGGR